MDIYYSGCPASPLYMVTALVFFGDLPFPHPCPHVPDNWTLVRSTNAFHPLSDSDLAQDQHKTNQDQQLNSEIAGSGFHILLDLAW